MTTPTTYISKIQQAFTDLRDGLEGLEASLLNWADATHEAHAGTPQDPVVIDEPHEEAEAQAPAAETTPEPAEEDSFPYSFEDVRQILGPIAKDGGKHAIQNALQHVGAKRLSDVDPKHYQSLIESVQQAVA